MKLVEAQLAQDQAGYVVIHFDAWLYQGFDDAKSALLEAIASKVMAEIGNDESLIEKGQALLKRINIFRSIGLLAEGVALASGVLAGGFISRTVETISKASGGIQSEHELNETKDIIQEGFSKAGGLFNEKTTQTPPQLIHEFRKEYGELLKALNKPVIVIIDNLDRWLPANAIHTLEAIRLFLFLDNRAFIIAADAAMIKTSVASHFKGSSSQHQLDYIDKLIQIPIRIPKAGVRKIRAYLFILYAIDHGLDKEMLDKLRKAIKNDLKLSWKQEQISINRLCDKLNLDDKNLEILFSQAERAAPILANSPENKC